MHNSLPHLFFSPNAHIRILDTYPDTLVTVDGLELEQYNVNIATVCECNIPTVKKVAVSLISPENTVLVLPERTHLKITEQIQKAFYGKKNRSF